MTKKITFFLVAMFLLNMAFSQETNNYSEDELIIKFKPGSEINFENCISTQAFGNAVLDALNQQFSVERIKLTGNKKLKLAYILKFTTNQDIDNLIELYSKTGLFEYVEPNFIGTGGGRQGFLQTIPNDTYFSRQYGLYNDGTFSLSTAVADADIDMELAWDIEQGDASVVVAILDSGARLGHPEFSGRVWANASEAVNSSDDDSNGYIDDTRGWDFANNDNDPTDDHGHGTNVAGIVGANGNNSTGYAGVDWNCKLMFCKILDNANSGYYSWWSDAIYYAVDHGADVINMSVGGSGYSTLLKTAIDYAYNNGVTVVACMMNFNNNVTYYPAGFANSIAVGSTDSDDDRSAPFFWSATSGSNYGSHIDVVAPGNYIYGLSYSSDTNYGSYWGGTSQATPLVSGLSALLLAREPSRTPDDIRSILRNSAEDQVGNATEDVAGFDNYFGYGRINAFEALSKPMPVELLSFEASVFEEAQVKLNWQTALEINNDHFTIERSQDGLEWDVLKNVKGAGNFSSPSFYTAYDYHPYFGNSFYRLKQSDFDGKSAYSQIRTVKIDRLEIARVFIYPNPTSKQITIEGNESELSDVKIYNVFGQDVTPVPAITKKMETKIILDLSNLNAGMYFLQTKTTVNKVYKQ